MGLFDKIFDIALPAGIGFATGGPVGAVTGGVSAARNAREAKRQEFLYDEFGQQIANQQGGQQMFIPSDITQGSTVARNPLPSTSSGGFGSTFGNFLTDFGSNVVNPLSGLFSSVRPFLSQQSVGQPALATNTNVGGAESQDSGTRNAFVGGAGNLLGQVSKFLRSPSGNIGTGIVGGIAGSLLGQPQQSIRITRKMKAQYRAVLNLNMGNYEAAADMIGVSTDFFVMVLLKRFRNDGPVVTKAALRKTKTTVRRLKSMCDMYDSLRPTATRRKAPMRRAGTTLISNK